MLSKKFLAQMLTMSLACLLSLPAMAQAFRGQVRGLVTDQTGSVLPGAKVTLSNVNTGVIAAKPTDNAGIYVFDFVEPGTYTVTVESGGFARHVQENVVVQSGGELTVDAMLTPGALQQSVTVTSTPSAVETTSSNVELTIDTKMANETPRADRNPFKLTLLEPAAVNTRGEMLPYQSWAANSVDLGGDTNLKNNLLVDGNPIGIGHKAGYPPNQDDVQESVVSQNSVEAASGHSAGGVISLTTKSGTNEWHGMAFYLGRYPWLSAQTDRTRHVTNAQRQNMYGGTFSNPIIKNKLFNFFSIEDWKINSPYSYTRTVPTALERGGDFSQSVAADGSERLVYDPFAAPTVDPSSGALVRTAFPGNVIPSSRFDPITAKLAPLFPDPNNAGQGPLHLNNFFKSGIQNTSYLNFSDRVDYVINDKWRVSGYYGRYHSEDSQTNPLNNTLYQPAGSLRGANQVLGDVIWTVTPNTVINFHGDWFNLIDAYVSKGLGTNGWSQIWNNSWYAPYLDASSNVPVYYPKLNVGASNFGGPGFFWDQRPTAEAFAAQVAQTKGSHYLTYGFEQRRGGGPVFVSNTNNFNFNQALTAHATSNPDLTKSGDPFATFLLGALDDSSQMVGGPAPNPITNFYGLYIGDTWKATRNLTVNAGLRYEYEAAWHDSNHYLSQGLDLTATEPSIGANPPAMPSQVTSIVGSSQSFAGVWSFTSGNHPGMWNGPKGDFQPRFGLAYRINDRTAVRFGYALYKEPTEYNFTPAPVSGFEDVNFLEPPFFGMTGYQYVAPLLNGVPQATFQDPFPASNPLVPIAGRSGGGNVGRGGSPLLWYPKNFQKAYNNRLSVTVEHQLPGEFIVSLGFFTNIGNKLYNRALNNIDPKILQSYSPDYLNNTSLNNPFYHYGSQTLLPGPLYNQKQRPLGSLLTKYPLYGALYEIGVRGASENYKDVELRVQKRWSKGYNFLFGYIYIRERSQINSFNDSTLYNNTLQWQDSNQPHHRLISAGTLELPFGHNKWLFSTVPAPVNTIIGCWQFTGLLTYISGDYPRFINTAACPACGNLIVISDPCKNIPSGYYFNPTAFSPVPANTYVLRSNPLQYNCIIGPSFANLDATLQKNIHVTERVQAQLRLNAYNATNKLNLADPNTNVYDTGLFGRAIYQGSPAGEFAGQTATYGNQAGRQLEIGLRLLF
ncbi:MAG TPA: TonB-dependent receptor [Acidobacteriaceae bacterium]